MDASGKTCNTFGNKTRKEILEQKKARESAIKAAACITDQLSYIPHLCYFRTNGLYVHLKSGRGDKLANQTKKAIKCLLKMNMEAPYGPEWPSEEKVKHREMVSMGAHYIFVYPIRDEENICDKDIVGFVHYRFVLEDDLPVLYVYELQLQPNVQGKGLGKFLMHLIEIIARKNGMVAVMLTVQGANLSARNFYIEKLRYKVSWSRVENGKHRSYEILCKNI